MKRLAFLAVPVLLLAARPASAARPEPVRTPGIMELLGDQKGVFAKDRRGADSALRAQSDGKNVVFKEGNFCIAFNDREITFLRVPAGADVLELSDFLYKHPWSRRLADKLKEGARLSDGELETLEYVYRAQIEAMKAIVSVGYEAVAFHRNVNTRAAAQEAGAKDPRFGSGTVLDESVQAFYERDGRSEKGETAHLTSDLLAWGRNFDSDERVPMLRRVVAGENSVAADKMTWREINRHFLVRPHMLEWHREIRIRRRDVNREARLDHWKAIHGAVSLRILRLYTLVSRCHTWQRQSRPDTFRKTFVDRMGRLEDENRLAVRLARELFYDFPFVNACAEFRGGVDDCRHTFGSNDVEGMRLAAANFLNDVAGDTMLLNVKSAYVYDEYLGALLFLKNTLGGDSMWAERREKGIRTYEDVLVSLRMKNLSDIPAFKACAGYSLWKNNALEPFEARQTATYDEARRREVDAERARAQAREAERARAEEIRLAEKQRKEEERLAEKQRLEAETEAKRIAAEERKHREAIEAERKRQEKEIEAERRRQEKEAEREAARLAAEERKQQRAIEAEEKRQQRELEAKERQQRAEIEYRERAADLARRRAERDAEQKAEQERLAIRREEAERKRLEQEAATMEAKKAAAEAGVGTGPSWFSRQVKSARGLFSSGDGASREAEETDSPGTSGDAGETRDSGPEDPSGDLSSAIDSILVP